MTMLNEEIVKEMSKYDDLFNGFSYNDIIQEKEEGEMEGPEDDNHPADTPHNTVTLAVEPQPVHKTSEADDSSDSDHHPPLQVVTDQQVSLSEGEQMEEPACLKHKADSVEPVADLAVDQAAPVDN